MNQSWVNPCCLMWHQQRLINQMVNGGSERLGIDFCCKPVPLYQRCSQAKNLHHKSAMNTACLNSLILLIQQVSFATKRWGCSTVPRRGRCSTYRRIMRMGQDLNPANQGSAENGKEVPGLSWSAGNRQWHCDRLLGGSLWGTSSDCGGKRQNVQMKKLLIYFHELNITPDFGGRKQGLFDSQSK